MATATDPSSQPDFVDLAGFVSIEGDGSASAVVAMAPGLHAMICIRQTGDKVDTILASGPFTVGE